MSSCRTATRSTSKQCRKADPRGDERGTGSRERLRLVYPALAPRCPLSATHPHRLSLDGLHTTSAACIIKLDRPQPGRSRDFRQYLLEGDRGEGSADVMTPVGPHGVRPACPFDLTCLSLQNVRVTDPMMSEGRTASRQFQGSCSGSSNLILFLLRPVVASATAGFF